MTDEKTEPKIPELSPAEWVVMQTFWQQGPQAARDVFVALPAGHGWAIKTVKTLLARLVAKKALDFDKIGNSYLYHPEYSAEEMTHEEIARFVHRISGGSPGALLSQLLDSGSLNDEEIEMLWRKLQKQRNKSDKKKKTI